MASKWFDRIFNFDDTTNDYVAIHQRLIGTPSKIINMVAGASEYLLAEKPDGKWSVKEHIGHLSVVEALWRTRILEIQAGEPKMTPADLDNTATSGAGFNNYSIGDLTSKFSQERNETILLLSRINPMSISNKSLHPRVQQYMGITDHLYFVAEHDDHHLDYIDAFLKEVHE